MLEVTNQEKFFRQAAWVFRSNVVWATAVIIRYRLSILLRQFLTLYIEIMLFVGLRQTKPLIFHLQVAMHDLIVNDFSKSYNILIVGHINIMPEWTLDIIKAIVPGIIIAVFTSILTVRFAIHRFHEEKWWEKKQEMYSRLLETLHYLKNYAAEHYEDQINPDHLTDEKREELTKEWEKFSREFAKLRDLASFHLSNKAVAILDQYEKKQAEARKSDDIFDWIDGDLAAVSECLEALKKVAKRDLKVK